MATATTERKVTTPAEWLAARTELLKEEKELTRRRDELARKRQELPWVKVEKPYTFESPAGTMGLAQLFGNKPQLFIYHFMLGPGWPAGCPSCSMLGDHMDGQLVHLAARDIQFTAVSRAPLAEIQAFQKRMGWKFPWVSSFGSDFNYDFGVSFRTPEERAEYNYGSYVFPAEEGPGASVFYKDAATGEVFHTYSSYGRGLEGMLGVYNVIDMTPMGRHEEGPHPMAWVKHHDRYEDAPAHSCCGGGSK